MISKWNIRCLYKLRIKWIQAVISLDLNGIVCEPYTACYWFVGIWIMPAIKCYSLWRLLKGWLGAIIFRATCALNDVCSIGLGCKLSCLRIGKCWTHLLHLSKFTGDLRSLLKLLTPDILIYCLTHRETCGWFMYAWSSRGFSLWREGVVGVLFSVCVFVCGIHRIHR